VEKNVINNIFEIWLHVIFIFLGLNEETLESHLFGNSLLVLPGKNPEQLPIAAFVSRKHLIVKNLYVDMALSHRNLLLRLAETSAEHNIYRNSRLLRTNYKLSKHNEHIGNI